jgi:hypothetical protein
MAGFGCPPRESVLIGRASAYVPEFHEILGRKAEFFAAGDEGVDRGSNDRVLGVRRIQQPQQDVRIKEDAHPLSCDPGICSRG